MTTVRLSAAHLAALEAEAGRAAPHEACALLTGTVSAHAITVQAVHISPNVTAGDPHRRFEIDPGLHLRLQRAAREGCAAIVGVWHSHPEGAARPSEEDRMRSTMKGWCWLITSRMDGATETAAFMAGADDPHSLEPVTLSVG